MANSSLKTAYFPGVGVVNTHTEKRDGRTFNVVRSSRDKTLSSVVINGVVNSHVTIRRAQ